MTTTTNANTEARTAMLKTLEALASSTYEDGTYNVKTLEAVDFKKGFQVTFCQIGDDYTDDEWMFLIDMFRELSMDGKTYAGKFESYPEISFRFASKKLAKRYAKMFNQISIWDWKHCKEIKTGGTGAR